MTGGLPALAIAVLPVLILLTGSIKIGVVLSILRQGLSGSAGIPPGIVTALIAVVLSALVMEPVAQRTIQAMQGQKADPSLVLTAGGEPLRAFLLAHTPPQERSAVLELALRLRRPSEWSALSGSDFSIIGTAFLLTELKTAFKLGIVLLLPFCLIDLLVAGLLQWLGLRGVSCITAALPFKLILFVLCDGWRLLAKVLLLGYS